MICFSCTLFPYDTDLYFKWTMWLFAYIVVDDQQGPSDPLIISQFRHIVFVSYADVPLKYQMAL